MTVLLVIFKTEYSVDPTVLDALSDKVETFEHWVYQQCLIAIDDFVKDQPYSQSYNLKNPLLDMEILRNTPLPEDVIKRQEALLEAKDLTMKKAQANEARALDQLENERLEK